jgi:hypothetical protein
VNERLPSVHGGACEVAIYTLDGYSAESGRFPDDDRQESRPDIVCVDQQGKSSARCGNGVIWHRKFLNTNSANEAATRTDLR